jgi:hypothetical protein
VTPGTVLTSKTVLESEREQVTALFAGRKGLVERLADRDPEDARKLLDPACAARRRSLRMSFCEYDSKF